VTRRRRGRSGGGRSGSAPKDINRALEGVLGELGLEAVDRARRVGECWAAAVGPEVAAHARPVGVRGAVLEVEVDAPVWAQQLQLRTPELLRALAQAMREEGDAPTELFFRIGGGRARGRGADAGGARRASDRSSASDEAPDPGCDRRPT